MRYASADAFRTALEQRLLTSERTENRLGTFRPFVLDLARGVAFIQAEQVLPVRDALDEVGAVYDVIPVRREV